MLRTNTTTSESESAIDSKTEVKAMASGIHDAAEPVAEMEVKPNERPHMSLGTYPEADSPKGFMISITPDLDSVEGVITQVKQAGSRKKHEFILHIANNSGQTVSAEVLRM